MILMLQDSLKTAADNGAAILLWSFTATAAYFLKQFADGVREMRREVVKLRVWIARIGMHVGVEETGAKE